MATEIEERIQEAVEIVEKAKTIAVFSGAGISVASGIPDFRSKGGLWEKYDPAVVANYHVFLNDPTPLWEMTKDVVDLMSTTTPNPGHVALARLEKEGKKEMRIITQNIDSLHTEAGSSVVYELHGHGRTASCIECHHQLPLKEAIELPLPPSCPSCGKKKMKPDMILFGESLPEGVFDQAMNFLQNSDVLIMVGSSLTVSPANQLPMLAKSFGAKLIFCTMEATPFDNIADVCLRGGAEVLLPKVADGVLGKEGRNSL